MRRSTAESFLLIFILSLVPLAAESWAQGDSLQLGTSFKRTLSRGQSHRFTVTLQPEDLAQIVVDQRGVDVVVRVMSADGKNLGEFDSPNGPVGPENVSFVAINAGSYSLDVYPLNQNVETSGTFEIRMVSVRRATPQELQAGRYHDVLKARGMTLLQAVMQTLPEIRSVQTRINSQLQIASLLRTVDDKLVRQLVADAITGIREYMQDTRNPKDDYQRYNAVNQMRQTGIQFLGQFDTELALTFIRSTRIPEEFNPQYNANQPDPEVAMEVNLANQIVQKDPNRAAKIAEDTLSRGYSSGFTNVISALRGTNPVMAARLASSLAAKLQDERLLTTPDAVNVTVNLLRLARTPSPRSPRGGGIAPLVDIPPLQEAEFRNLFGKALADALAYSPLPEMPYSQEMNSARTLLTALKGMPELNSLAPGSLQAIEEKLLKVAATANTGNRFNEAINGKSVDAALETIRLAPQEMRSNLYQQLAQKVAREGDLTRGKQILQDGIPNSFERRNALNNLEQQAIYEALNKGRVDEVLQAILNLTPQQRINTITSLVNQLERGQKKESVLSFLDQARALLGTSVRAEDQNQMSALLQIAMAYGRQGSTRGFEIVEPLIDQFNELSVAAVTLNGFGQNFFEEGELTMNGNSLGNIASQLNRALGSLALVDFDRTKQDVERMRRPEVRVAAYIAIAQQSFNPPPVRR